MAAVADDSRGACCSHDRLVYRWVLYGRRGAGGNFLHEWGSGVGAAIGRDSALVALEGAGDARKNIFVGAFVCTEHRAESSA
jgi:hypothetical protein